MLKTTIIAATLMTTFGMASARAQQVPFESPDLEVSAFQSQPLEVALATDKQTGRKFSVVKLKNGHMMGVVTADEYMALRFGAPNTYGIA